MSACGRLVGLGFKDNHLAKQNQIATWPAQTRQAFNVVAIQPRNQPVRARRYVQWERNLVCNHLTRGQRCGRVKSIARPAITLGHDLRRAIQQLQEHSVIGLGDLISPPGKANLQRIAGLRLYSAIVQGVHHRLVTGRTALDT